MLRKEYLCEILKAINGGGVSVLYLTRNSFRLFLVLDGKIHDFTDKANILSKIEVKEGARLSDFDKEKLYKKYKEVSKITMGGCGYDKAGSFLSGLARKLINFKELETFQLTDSLLAGCDASYRSL